MGGRESSGGSSGGKSSWPAYMERIHWALGIGAYGTDADNPDHGLWSTRGADYGSEPAYYSVLRDITEAHDVSPFVSAEAYDPETRLSNMTTQVVLLTTLVNALDHDADFSADWTTAKTEIDAVISTAEKTALVDQFKSDTAKAHANSMARATAAAADVGANNDAAYIMMKGIMESRYTDLVGNYTASVANRQYELKLEMYDRAVQQLSQRLFHTVDSLARTTATKIESERISLVAEKEEVDRNVDLDVQDSTWELQTWQYGANVLGAISGSIGQPGHQGRSGPSALGGAISGGVSGAAMGALGGAVLGSMTGMGPLVGAGLGAAIFGASGATSGYFG